MAATAAAGGAISAAAGSTDSKSANPGLKLHDRFRKILESAGLDLTKLPSTVKLTTGECAHDDQSAFFPNSKATVLYLGNLDRAVIRFGTSIDEFSFTDRFTVEHFTTHPNLTEVLIVKEFVKKALG